MKDLSIFYVLDTNENILGTGFLVGKNLGVTCTHIVLFDEHIKVRFVGNNNLVSANLLSDYQRGVEDGDVTFLRFEFVPDNIKPVNIGLAEHSYPGNQFRSFGFATAADVSGIYVNGTIDGYLQEHRLIQLQSAQANNGVSGAPVFDEKRGVVIGMITKGHTDLGRNQYTTFATPSELLLEACPEIHPFETAPYLGLETFTDKTAQYFFGRNALTEKLVDALRGGCRFLAVFGPSGSGKSSVVQAGLLPALKTGQLPGSQKWTQITMRPADNPFEQMQAAGLNSIDINSYLNLHKDVECVVLFIDQFEELFVLTVEVMRDRFVRDLVTALENSKLILVLSMRDDFYSTFNAKAAYLAESEHLNIINVPGTLKRGELIEIIERPAEKHGIAIEEGLTELIIKDLTRESVWFIIRLTGETILAWLVKISESVEYRGYQ